MPEKKHSHNCVNVQSHISKCICAVWSRLSLTVSLYFLQQNSVVSGQCSDGAEAQADLGPNSTYVLSVTWENLPSYKCAHRRLKLSAHARNLISLRCPPEETLNRWLSTEDSDEATRTLRLICIITGRTYPKVLFYVVTHITGVEHPLQRTSYRWWRYIFSSVTSSMESCWTN